MIKNQREEMNLQLASQLLQFSDLIKESADSLVISNHCAFMVSETHSFSLSKLTDSHCFTTYELALVDEVNSKPTYMIHFIFGLGFVKVELKRYKESIGDYIELYLAKGGLAAPSLTTLKVLVSNIHTTSAVSLFSEGLRLLGFEGKL